MGNHLNMMRPSKFEPAMPQTRNRLAALAAVPVAALPGLVPFAHLFTPDPADAGTQQQQTLVVLAGLLAACLSVVP